MAAPIKKYKLGQIEGAVFQNEFADANGEKKISYSVKFQKSYKKKDGAWENTEYFYDTDLRTLYALVGAMLDKQVKISVPEAKPTTPQPQPQPSSVPPQSSSEQEVPF